MSSGPRGAERPGRWSTAILAGGLSSRFGGPKLLARVGGETLIRRVARAGFPESGDLMVVIGQDEDLAIEDAVRSEIGDMRPRLIRDTSGPRTPAAGIEAALLSAVSEYVFVVAVDLPFLVQGFAGFLAARGRGHAAAVPFYRGFYEPTCAVYATAMLPVISEYRVRPGGPISGCFARPGLTVVRVGEDEILRFGEPSLLFFNVNAREDLGKAEALFSSGALSKTERGVPG